MPTTSSQAQKASSSTQLHHLRDGEVVLYKRANSKVWQARFKLNDSKWHRISTKQRNIDYASKAACEAYDRARFLKDENIPISSKRFDAVARQTVAELQQQLDSGVGKVVYNTYIQAIRLYLIPFFGKYNINNIRYEELKKFGEWRLNKFGRTLAASTVTNHTSALNRVFDTAIERGWLSKQQVPTMKNNGAKPQAREAFSLAEYRSLTAFMPHWIKKGHTEKTLQMRELLRDYVLILANTGMRHGTEAQNIKWRDIEWITKDGERYLQITVNGKTGKRTLIARHNTEDYLIRIQQRFDDLAKLSFDALLKKKLDVYVFRLRSGERTKALIGTFRNLMRDSGLDKDREVKERRSLYSLRHTYAHFSLLTDAMDVHTLAKQMGTSVKMIEQHYGHIAPAMKADIIAGTRMGKRREPEQNKDKAAK